VRIPRFTANLTLLYTELPFLDRTAATARDNFETVEYQFPYEHPTAEFTTRLSDNNLPLVLMNTPPDNATTGERNLAALPERETNFQRAVNTTLTYASAVQYQTNHQ
jgi:Hydroxypyruvate isomerase